MLFHLFIFQRLQIALALLACALFFLQFLEKKFLCLFISNYTGNYLITYPNSWNFALDLLVFFGHVNTGKICFSSRENMIGWDWWRHGWVQSKHRHFEHGRVLVSGVSSKACILQNLSWKWSWPGRCLVAVNENHPRDTACIA